jgi:hypothetical protein
MEASGRSSVDLKKAGWDPPKRLGAFAKAKAGFHRSFLPAGNN